MANNQGPFPVAVPDAEFNQKVSNCILEEINRLILWRNWKKSVLVFVVLQILIFDFANESAIRVFCIWILFGLLLTIGYRVYVRCLQCINKTHIQGNPYQKYLDMDINISEEAVRQLVLLVPSKTFGFLIQLKSVVFVTNFWKTLKWMVVFSGMCLIGEFIYISTLVHLGLVLLFTIPKICTWTSNFYGTEKSSQFQIQSPISEEMDITSSNQSNNGNNIKQESQSGSDNTKTFKEAINEMDISSSNQFINVNYITQESQGIDNPRTFEAINEFERLDSTLIDEELTK
ncbi:reticulon-1-A isoform X2 [Drosophila gunungcola]|uniref:reticulon-1-A isoform X2 n=1 Tax=Drosophila gunungcola TaxID=103775 RepID=UPI0022E64EB9|nr:reticulon-1-A isoform X2 [Drosophila gunungcola]